MLIAGVSPLQVKVPFNFLFVVAVHHFASWFSAKAIKMGFKFKRMSLKADDSKRTRAAELTLRQSLYPIILVTTLFFLWVSELSRCQPYLRDKD